MITLQFPHITWQLARDSIIIIGGVTDKDYWELSSEDLKVEYSRGWLYIHSPASIKHEQLLSLLQLYFNYYLQRNELGEVLGSRVALEFPAGHRPEPDLVYLPTSDYHNYETAKVFKGVPPWLIEILSSSTKTHDLETKLAWYTEAKVPEIWYIDMETPFILRYWLEESTQTYIRDEVTTGTISPKLFPNLEVQISWLTTRPKVAELIERFPK